jgi:hypothetical protein
LPASAIKEGSIPDRHQPRAGVAQPRPTGETAPDPNGSVLEHVFRVVAVAAETPKHCHEHRAMCVEQF